jgi:hypothetical protein
MTRTFRIEAISPMTRNGSGADRTPDGVQDLDQHQHEHQPIDDWEYRAGAAPVAHSLQ